MTEVVRRALVDLIADRIEDQTESERSLHLAELSHHLTELAALDPAQAERLLAAEEVELGDQQIKLLAEGLEIHEDVLRCLITPTSAEIAAHVLKNVVAPTLNTDTCTYCESLSVRIYSIDLLNSEEIAGLMLGVLEHLSVQRAAGDCEDDLGESGDLLADQLLAVFESLPQDAQMRVMAAAYHEAGGRPISNPLGGMYTLRAECDSQLLLRALDHLAANGTIAESHLARELGLRDPKALSHLLSIWESSLAKIEALGYHLDPSGLSVSVSADGERLYSLSPEPASVWRSLGLAAQTV